MSLISKLFGGQKIDCPRCLGKGEVDRDDIKRFNKELKWIPGKCAYCYGTGKVSSRMASKVKADNTYLTTDIPQEERKRLFNADFGAIQRADYYDAQIDNFIKRIEYLYFVGNIDAHKIADFYLIPKPDSEITVEERQEIFEYVEKVIEKKKTDEQKDAKDYC
ncbi:MAG: hypothetical protein ABI861_02200 [Panacibacter sp.]